jgi:hypothetical protein
MSDDHCPACTIAADLTKHRDATATDWSFRRGTLNFAIVVARRACPAYVPIEATVTEEKS